MPSDTLKIKTVTTLDKTEVVEFYQALLQQQSDNYSNLITLLLGLTTILVGSSVLWNFVVSKNQIKNEINLLTDSLKAEISNSVAEITGKRFDAINTDLKNTLKENEAHLARLYAINAGKDGYHTSAVNWWIRAIIVYKELQDDFALRVCVDAIIDEVNKPNWTSEKKEKFDPDKAIKYIEECVPEILSNEKKIIIEKLRLKIRID